MIIKKYLANTEKEAIDIAKKELGENIVIMNVKNTKKKGFLGLFGATAVEVTVALEAENDKIGQVFGAKKETTGPIVPDYMWDKQVPKKTQERIVESEETGKAIVEKLDGLQILLQQQLLKDKIEENKSNEEIVDEVKDKKKSDEGMTFVKLLYNTMIDNEVADKYANDLIDEIERSRNAEMQIDFVLANVYQKMILKFLFP